MLSGKILLVLAILPILPQSIKSNYILLELRLILWLLNLLPLSILRYKLCSLILSLLLKLLLLGDFLNFLFFTLDNFLLSDVIVLNCFV